jgi:tetratricopeptide (TPR) repeat protein
MKRTRFAVPIFFLLFTAGLASAAAPVKDAYPFAVPPNQAFATLARLEKSSGLKLPLTPDEVSLFNDASDGKLDDCSFADACLIASGVTDPVKRKEYLKKIDAIEAGARKAVAGAKTPFEKGEKLLKFLHAGPMAKGCRTEQSDLHTLLDTGHFNCVSSAVLYNVIGRRLGLDLRAIEIPEHVFSILYDGDRRADVETTNARGFNPSRDPKLRDAAKNPGGVVYMPEKHAKLRREVGETGLAAIIAYNHGVTLSKEKRFHEAVLANFRALCLDPKNQPAIKNALADLTNGPLALAKEGKYEEALNAVAIALELAPKDSGLKNNHKVLWWEYAEKKMKAGQEDEAVAVLRRAAKAIPAEDFESRQAYLFLNPAIKLTQEKKWNEAIALVDAGSKKVDAKAKKKLRDARVGFFLNWGIDEQKAGRFEEALSILRRAAAEENDKRILNNRIATYDAWARTFMDKGEWKKAIEIYEKGMNELPGDKHLSHNLVYCREQMKK